MTSWEYQTELSDEDPAIDGWGSAASGEDPLLASFTLEPFSPVRPHVPFYRFFHYPDVLDLRRSGFEVERFKDLFDALENARYSQALRVRQLLHYQLAGDQWNARRAREFEFKLRAAFHRNGISDVPTLLRRMLGRAFPDDSITALSIDLLNVFFWACMAEVAKDYFWKEPELVGMASYLEYPVRVSGLHQTGNQQAA